MPRIINWIRGLLFALGGTCSVAFLAPILIVFPIVFLLPFSHSKYRRWCDLVDGYWHDYMTSMIHFVLGTKMVFTGDNLPKYIPLP